VAAPGSTRGLAGTRLARLADALTLARIGVALVLPWALMRGGWLSLVLFAAAALSDYVDGPLARRSGRTAHYGAVLDVAADVAFVLSGLVTVAALGSITWAAPAAIAVSVTAFALASTRLPPQPARPPLARSRLGHAAGIVNYVLVGLVCGAAAMPGAPWVSILGAGGLVVTLLNLAAVAARASGAK
jgi:phosphatidylglycerophosphate synthase